MGDENKQETDGALFFDDEGEDERPIKKADQGSAGDGKAEQSLEFLAGVLSRMGLHAKVAIREDDERVVLDVTGADAGRAIGKKGMTLDALQFLVNKVVNRFPSGRRYIIVDSGDYRDRHDEGLISMAEREAKRAVESGRVVTLEPMPARDRRLIHLSLAKFPEASTKSTGEGIGRRIQIIPARITAGGGGAGGGVGGGGGGGGGGRGDRGGDRGGDRARRGPRPDDGRRDGGRREGMDGPRGPEEGGSGGSTA